MDDVAMVLTDVDGQVRYWSAGAERAFGHGAEVAVGRTLDLIIPAEYRAGHWAGFRRAMEKGVAGLDGQVSPFPVRRADGEVAETPGRLTLLRGPSGRAVGAMVVFG